MTPKEGLQIQIEAYRRMTPQQRLQVSFRLYQLTRTLVRQGVKHQNPEWNEHQVEQEVMRRFRLGAGIPDERCSGPVAIAVRDRVNSPPCQASPITVC